MRLTDHLAATRCLYPRPAGLMPDILLIDVPACFGGPTLPLGRYYPIILETADELAELGSFLAKPREELVLPDLFERRPSHMVSECVVIARYPPPSSHWPWILLCHWPVAYTRLAPPGADLFAREAYTIEVLASYDDLTHTENQLRATLNGHEFRHIGDGMRGIGHA